MSNVIDINRVQLDRAIKKWEETGRLRFNTSNKVLYKMIKAYFESINKLNTRG